MTLRFGVLYGDCRNETEYIDNAEKMTREIMQAEDWEIDDLFWGNPPKKEKNRIYMQKNIRKYRESKINTN